jgi:hypothetical protein
MDGCLCPATVAPAEDSTQPATSLRGDAVLSQVEVTATVTKVDHKTREVTLKTKVGGEATFIAEPAVRSLAQVNRGDVVTATYTEAPAYEVKKGGKARADTTIAAAGPRRARRLPALSSKRRP